MAFSLIPHIDGSESGALDPRIDPRLMWPLQYLEDRLGFVLADSPANVLHGDILRADLERGPLRVRVTWVPRTEQIFVSQGRRLLAVHARFPELAAALEALTVEHAAAA
jgi:hypothetical protein